MVGRCKKNYKGFKKQNIIIIYDHDVNYWGEKGRLTYQKIPPYEDNGFRTNETKSEILQQLPFKKIT